MTSLNSLFCCFETSYLMQTRKYVAPLEPPQGANRRADKNGLSRVRRATQMDISEVRNASRRGDALKRDFYSTQWEIQFN
jgi:hypothetical protein